MFFFWNKCNISFIEFFLNFAGMKRILNDSQEVSLFFIPKKSERKLDERPFGPGALRGLKENKASLISVKSGWLIKKV